MSIAQLTSLHDRKLRSDGAAPMPGDRLLKAHKAIGSKGIDRLGML